jgi:hypothetical protein
MEMSSKETTASATMNIIGNLMSTVFLFLNFFFFKKIMSVTTARMMYDEQTERYPNICNDWVRMGTSMVNAMETVDATRTPFNRSLNVKTRRNGDRMRMTTETSINMASMA